VIDDLSAGGVHVFLSRGVTVDAVPSWPRKAQPRVRALFQSLKNFFESEIVEAEVGVGRGASG